MRESDTPGNGSAFMDRLASKLRVPTSGVVLEDRAFWVRMPMISGSAIVLNSAAIVLVSLANDEEVFAWSLLFITFSYLVAVAVFLLTARIGLYMNIILWPSVAQHIFGIIVLGGIIWSGGILFWGIILAVVVSLFLGRVTSIVVASIYLTMAIVFAFLEPTLQASREQPALTLTVFLGVNVFVMSLLIIVPIVLILIRQMNTERARSESLLLNVLPRPIATRLKKSRAVIADSHENCTVLFADMVGFTDHTLQVSPEQLIQELNEVFSRFDELVEVCGAEKIKTMGDGYMAVAGVPTARTDHVDVICDLALRMQEAMSDFTTEFALRVGVATGPLVAGVVGTSRFSYDLWGQTVNLASRMETTCPPGSIQVTDRVAQAVASGFSFDRHGVTDVKGVGPVKTCLLVGRKPVTVS